MRILTPETPLFFQQLKHSWSKSGKTFFFYTNISRQFASSSIVEGSKINLLLPSLFACLKLVNFKDEKWWWVGNSSWKSVNLAKRRNTATGWAFDHRRHQRDVFQPRQFCSFAILPSAQMAKVQFLTYILENRKNRVISYFFGFPIDS